MQQAGAVLHDMLAEVVNSSDVASALDSLLEADTPTLAELQHGQKLSQAALPLPAELPRRDSSHDTDAASTHDSGSAGDRSQHSNQRQAADERGPLASEATAAQQYEETAAEGMLDKLLQQPDFQAFAEFVLDSACFNLLQESAAGDWQPAGNCSR